MANNHGNFDFDLATSNGVQVAIGLLSSLSSVMPHEKVGIQSRLGVLPSSSPSFKDSLCNANLRVFPIAQF